MRGDERSVSEPFAVVTSRRKVLFVRQNGVAIAKHPLWNLPVCQQGERFVPRGDERSVIANRFAVIALSAGSAVRQAKRCGNLSASRESASSLAVTLDSSLRTVLPLLP